MTNAMKALNGVEKGYFAGVDLIRVRFPEFDGSQHCQTADTNLMYGGFDDDDEYAYGTPKDNMATAVRVCEGCPFKQPCAEWGIAHEEFGVWGGLTQTQRHNIRKKLNIGVARPEYWNLYFGKLTPRRQRYLEWKRKQEELEVDLDAHS